MEDRYLHGKPCRGYDLAVAATKRVTTIMGETIPLDDDGVVTVVVVHGDWDADGRREAAYRKKEEKMMPPW